jgi:hypothetical protein
VARPLPGTAAYGLGASGRRHGHCTRCAHPGIGVSGKPDSIKRFFADFGRLKLAIVRGYANEFAEKTIRQLEGFGSCDFPESHAASFALIAYASSWIKCRHPDVFCASLLLRSRWVSTRRRRSCAMPATTTLKSVPSASMPRAGTARWNRWRR